MRVVEMLSFFFLTKKSVSEGNDRRKQRLHTCTTSYSIVVILDGRPPYDLLRILSPPPLVPNMAFPPAMRQTQCI